MNPIEVEEVSARKTSEKRIILLHLVGVLQLMVPAIFDSQCHWVKSWRKINHRFFSTTLSVSDKGSFLSQSTMKFKKIFQTTIRSRKFEYLSCLLLLTGNLNFLLKIVILNIFLSRFKLWQKATFRRINKNSWQLFTILGF